MAIGAAGGNDAQGAGRMKSCTFLSFREDRLKDLSVINGLSLSANTNPDYELDYLEISNVDYSGIIEPNNIERLRFEDAPSRARRVVTANCVIISSVRPNLQAVAFFPDNRANFVCSTGFNVIQPNETKLHPKFVYYVIVSEFARQYFEATAKGVGYPAIGDKEFGSLPFPLPPLPEQVRIAAYLDASCAAIDAAVNAKKKQIESLEKLIESTIFNAVTGGINNQFAKKPSGLDWIDTIPSHWKVQQIKRRCNILRGKFSHRPRNDPAFYGGEYPFIQTGDITAAAKYIQSYSQTLNELGLSVSKMFPQNTLVMTIAANIGDVAILDFEACFPDSIVGLVPDHNTDLNYLYYLMIAIKRLLLRAAILTTQLNLNNVRIGTIFVPFPPVEEQTQIAEQLEDKILKIRHIITNIESQIATLIDYRKSLIHECVTGQRRISETDVAKVERTLEQAAAGLPQQ